MIQYLKFSLFIYIAAFMNATALETSEYSSGIAALNRGELDLALEKLTIAYKKNPSDPEVKFVYATLAQCSIAVPIYKALIFQKNVSDSLKGCAYEKLGSHSYISKDYKNAIYYYRNASRTGKKPEYRHLWALSESAAGNFEEAKSIWHTLTLEYGDTLSEIAQYHLGLLNIKQKKYSEALVCLSKSGTPSNNHPWSIDALVAKIECARKLGMNQKAAEYEVQLQPYRNLLLEKQNAFENQTNTVQVNDSTGKNQKSNIPSVIERTDSVQQYTLQVGAFSLKENAHALAQKVKVQYKNVSVVPIEIEDKIFYKVWIGIFTTKIEAENYGADSLKKDGLSFRVVERN